MKKLFAILLAGVMLLGFAGCQIEQPQVPYYPHYTMNQGDTDTDLEGLEIRIEEMTWHQADGRITLTVAWLNGTDFDVTYGSAYVIERLEGETWVSCLMDEDLVFDAIGYALKAGQSRRETYNLKDVYDVSAPGTYRFKTECYFADDDGETVTCSLTAEFTVEKKTNPDGGALWTARYIRTDGYSEAVQFPGIRVIHSLQELRDYYNTWHEVFDLERKDRVYSDTSIGFLDACDAYDEGFFEDNYLIFVLLEEGSGSIRHEVRGVTRTDFGQIIVSVDRNVPEIGTADMAQWHIILEMSREMPAESSMDVLLFVDGQRVYMDDTIVAPQTEGAFKKPPLCTIFTPEVSIPLQPAGYSWFCRLSNGLMEGTNADQAGRPLPRSSLKPVSINSQFAETVYTPSPDSEGYVPTDSMGYLVKLDWEGTNPASVAYTCWPDAVWRDGSIPEEAVDTMDGAFYAKPGSYIYEIKVTWEDTGVGYYGTANYYVYIIGGDPLP